MENGPNYRKMKFFVQNSSFYCNCLQFLKSPALRKVKPCFYLMNVINQSLYLIGPETSEAFCQELVLTRFIDREIPKYLKFL